MPTKFAAARVKGQQQLQATLPPAVPFRVCLCPHACKQLASRRLPSDEQSYVQASVDHRSVIVIILVALRNSRLIWRQTLEQVLVREATGKGRPVGEPCKQATLPHVRVTNVSMMSS